MRYPLWLCAPLLALSPALVQAQDCTVIRNRTFNVTNQGLPTEVGVYQNAEVACPGGRRLIADQITQVRASGRVVLVGRVSYSDGERALTAERAEYYRTEQHLHATGNVVLRDLKTGSTIYGQDIDYYQVTASRPEALLRALPASIRPRAVLRDEQRSGGPGRDSTTVEADMIEVLGDQHFRGLGSAIIRRDSLTGYGGIADYDQASGEMQLAGQGRVEGRDYQLLGDTIRARLERDTLREVTAYRNANLTTRDTKVEAPRIRIELLQGQVERMTAVRSRDSAALAMPAFNQQPSIVAEQFRLAADSIDVRAPRQELEEVIAIGDAYSSTNDTIPAPPDVGELATALSTDWMRGDTVHAFFEANPQAATDTTAEARVLDRVVASGAPASSLYRRQEPPAPAPAVPPADSTQAVPAASYSIGYLLARRIEVKMGEGEVRDVTASEDVRGVYLQPRTGTAIQAGRTNERRP